MWRQISQVLPVFLVSVLASGMGLLFAVTAMAFPSPQTRGAIPAALACIAVGMLGSAVLAMVGKLNYRVQELEQRLKEGEERNP